MIESPLPPGLRRARILERVQRDGSVTLAELASDYAVSPVTVHRDLELLSSEGLLERVHGGARALPGTRPRIETAWTARVRDQGREKDAIALGVTAESIHVIVAPGELNQHMRVLTGRWTVDFLTQLNVATAFISAAGITLEHGLTTSRKSIADTLDAATRVAGQTVALMDSSKFRRASLLSIADAVALDLVITDDGLDAVAVAEYRQAGVNLALAPFRDA